MQQGLATLGRSFLRTIDDRPTYILDRYSRLIPARKTPAVGKGGDFTDTSKGVGMRQHIKRANARRAAATFRK